jgi:hypothetical protein
MHVVWIGAFAIGGDLNLHAAGLAVEPIILLWHGPALHVVGRRGTFVGHCAHDVSSKVG